MKTRDELNNEFKDALQQVPHLRVELLLGTLGEILFDVRDELVRVREAVEGIDLRDSGMREM